MQTQMSLLSSVLKTTVANQPERVIEIRGQKVMLDRDVAEALGVESRDVNQNAKDSPKWGVSASKHY